MTEPTPTVIKPLIILLVPTGIVTGLVMSGLWRKDREIEKGRTK